MKKGRKSAAFFCWWTSAEGGKAPAPFSYVKRVFSRVSNTCIKNYLRNSIGPAR
jgi:hypothetical protein